MRAYGCRKLLRIMREDAPHDGDECGDRYSKVVKHISGEECGRMSCGAVIFASNLSECVRHNSFPDYPVISALFLTTAIAR